MGEGEAPRAVIAKRAIVTPLAFQKTRRAMEFLNIWWKREEWVHDMLAFAATIDVLFLPFESIEKLALVIEWVVQV